MVVVGLVDTAAGAFGCTVLDKGDAVLLPCPACEAHALHILTHIVGAVAPWSWVIGRNTEDNHHAIHNEH